MDMENIRSVEDLKSAIQVLEVEQSEKELIFKEQFHLVYESLRPINMIRSTLNDLFSMSSSAIGENLSVTAFGEAGGFLLKKLFVGKSGNVFRKLLGTLLQLGVTSFASRKSDVIISTVQSLFQRFFQRKEEIPEEDS
jgi:hypothetical protein